MILQIVNVTSGLVLTFPQVKQYLNPETGGKIEANIKAWQPTLGLVTLILGLIGLIDRLNLISFYIPEFGSSFPQALPALLTGALLALPKLERYPTVTNQIQKLLPYATILGYVSIASGLGSLLFGCIVPVFCHVPF